MGAGQHFGKATAARKYDLRTNLAWQPGRQTVVSPPTELAPEPSRTFSSPRIIQSTPLVSRQFRPGTGRTSVSWTGWVGAQHHLGGEGSRGSEHFGQFDSAFPTTLQAAAKHAAFALRDPVADCIEQHIWKAAR